MKKKKTSMVEKHSEKREQPKGTRQENSEQRSSAESVYNRRQPTFTRNDRRAKEIVDTVEHMDNDPEWYRRNAGMVESVGNLPYGWPVGQELDLRVRIPNDTSTGKKAVTIPGVMNLHFQTTPGVSANDRSPINKAGLANYRYIRFKKNGNTPYEVPDLIMTYLAMDSLYCLWAMAARVYKYSMLYTPMNDYLPSALIKANHFDPDDIKQHQADFLFEINLMATSLQKVAVPAALSMYDRHLWMLSNYFADSQSTKAQLYQFVMDGYWTFNNLGETGTSLTYSAFPDNMSHDQFYRIFDSVYDALVKDQDFGTMMGDIENAYSPSGLRSAPITQAGELILPIYSEEVLSQIENATAWGPFSAGNTITQNPEINEGNIVYAPTVELDIGTDNIDTQGAGCFVTTLLNSHGEGQPSNDFNMVASRLHSTLDYTAFKRATDTAVAQCMLRGCGTEYVTKFSIYFSPNAKIEFLSHMNGSAGSIDSIDNQWLVATAISQFDWHPFVYVGSVSSTTEEFVGIIGDVDNYQIAEQSVIDAMHTVAIMSEFTA